MDQNTNPNQEFRPEPNIGIETHKRSLGPAIGTAIIVLLLVLAAIFVWGQKLNNDAEKNLEINNPETQNTPAPVVNDDFTAVEKELESLDDLDDLNF